MARNRICAAAATAAAQSPGPLRDRTFRSQPGRAAPPEPLAEFLALGKVPESPRLSREVVLMVSVFPVLRRALLVPEAPAFLLAWGFPLLPAPAWISSFSCPYARFLSRGTFSLRISAWALACGAALILAKHWARASRAASALALFQFRFSFPNLRSLVLLWETRWASRAASQKVDVSLLIYLLPPLLRGSETFLVSETAWRVSRFARIDHAGFFVLH